MTQTPTDDAQIASWVDTFNRDGCLFVEDVLPSDWCDELREDLVVKEA